MARKLRPSVLVGAALAASLFVCNVRGARAQTASEIATAKQWFAEGLAHEEKDEFGTALDLFRRASQVKRTPQIVYHVGFCESRTGALVEALVDLDSAAALGRAAHAEDVVTAARAELSEVQRRIPHLEVHDVGATRPARFVVDGNAIALSMLRTAMPLDPGEHTVTLEYASGANATQKVTLAERDTKTIEIGSPPAAAQASTSAPATSATTVTSAAPATSLSSPIASSSQHAASTLPWIVVGIGGALAIGGGVLVGAAHAKESSLHDACPTRQGCDPALSGDYDTATTLNTVGLVLGAVGVVGLGVGVSMVVFRPSPSTSAALAVTPRGVDLTARF
jgi:hypothetical protein